MTETSDAPTGATPLPNGGWLTLRDPKTVKQRDRKAVWAAMDRVSQAGGGSLLQTIESGAATMCLAVASWSYDLPLPSEDPASLDELDIPTYNAVSEACKPFADAVFPSFKPSAEDTERKDPSGPSSD